MNSTKGFNTIVSKTFSSPLTKYLRSLRGTTSTFINNKNLHHSLPKILRNNEVLAVMSDQNPNNNEHIVLWDTIRIPSSVSLFSFLIQKRAIVIPITSAFQKDNIVIKYHTPLKPSNLPAQLQQFLENSIENNPNYWNWSYIQNKIVDKA